MSLRMITVCEKYKDIVCTHGTFDIEWNNTGF